MKIDAVARSKKSGFEKEFESFFANAPKGLVENPILYEIRKVALKRMGLTLKDMHEDIAKHGGCIRGFTCLEMALPGRSGCALHEKRDADRRKKGKLGKTYITKYASMRLKERDAEPPRKRKARRKKPRSN